MASETVLMFPNVFFSKSKNDLLRFFDLLYMFSRTLQTPTWNAVVYLNVVEKFMSLTTCKFLF